MRLSGRRIGLISLALIPYAALDAFILFTDTRWIGEGNWTVDFANAGLYLASVLLAGASAFFGKHYFRASFAEGTSGPSIVRRGRIVLRHTIEMFVPAYLLHLLVAGGALLVTVRAGGSAGFDPWLAIVPIAPIAIHIGLGAAIGAFLPNVLGAVAAVAFAYFVNYAAATWVLNLPLAIGGVNVSTAGLLVEWEAAARWLIVGIVVTGVALLVAALLIVESRRESAIAAAVVVVALVTAGAVPLPQSIWRVNPDPDLSCTDLDSETEVCVLSGHDLQIVQVAAGLRAALDVVRNAGGEAPDRYTEQHSDEQLADGVLNLPASELNRPERFTTWDYANAIVIPADCAEYRTNADSPLFAVQVELADWIAAQLGAGQSERAGSWAAAAYNDLRRCTASAETLRALEE